MERGLSPSLSGGSDAMPDCRSEPGPSEGGMTERRESGGRAEGGRWQGRKRRRPFSEMRSRPIPSLLPAIYADDHRPSSVGRSG